MKISELIDILQITQRDHGDLECCLEEFDNYDPWLIHHDPINQVDVVTDDKTKIKVVRFL